MNTKTVRQRKDRIRATYRPGQTASYTLDNMINYDWNRKQHKFNLTAVNSISYKRYEDMYLYVNDLPYKSYWYAMEDGATVMGYYSNFWEWSLVSFMGRLNYSFADKYLVTLTSRWDGSSKLAEGHKWDFFPSAALAWRASDEPFIHSLNVFSNLKFRLSYGEVGNDDIDPYSTQALVTSTSYSFGSGVTGSAPAGLANSKLGWEHSKEVNLGLDIGLLDNKITLTTELYNRKTLGLIVNRAIPPSLGFNTITGNFASTRNKGIELTLNTTNISSKDFTWSTNINFAKNKNKILSLAEDGLSQMESSESVFSTSGINYNREYIVGEDILSHYFYEFDGIFQSGEETSALAQSMYGSAAKAGWVKVKDQNGDGKITADDKTVLGTETPSWTGGITNNFKYKNWDFSFFLYTVQDVFIFDNVWQALGRSDKYDEKRLSFINYWLPSNPSNTWDSPTASANNIYNWSKYFHNTSWIRLQNVTLGYSLPRSVLNQIGLHNVRFYATANNPLLISDYKGKGFDPEWAAMDSNGVGISATSYIFGVNVTF
jgi:TonB-linked SusC/RagA family outer membrane protein